MPARPRIAIIGAGIGGLAVAGFLEKQGADVIVYEQARKFLRVGAGIQMGPNAVHVLRALGLEPKLRVAAFYSEAWTHRTWDTGAHLADLTFGQTAEQQYGAPYFLMHRGDLHAALFSIVPEARLDDSVDRTPGSSTECGPPRREAGTSKFARAAALLPPPYRPYTADIDQPILSSNRHSSKIGHSERHGACSMAGHAC